MWEIIKQFFILNYIRIKNPSIKLKPPVYICKKDFLKGLVRFGKRVQLLRNVAITGKVSIGDYSYCNNSTELFASSEHGISIGKFCSIARSVFIVSTNDHDVKKITTYPIRHIIGDKDFKDLGTEVKIGNDVWIGANSVILSGTEISNGAVVGAGSVVKQNTKIGPYEVWAGVPAKKVSDRFSEQTKNKLVKLEWWNWDLKKIKKNKQIFSKQV
ncbi:MAG: CatB-related O-acetyltransferase [bacterium]